MGLSEKVDSGKFSCGRSNFSQTCSLLSQYLKEKGSFGDLSLGMTPNLPEPKGTMNLLPMIEKSGPTGAAGNFNINMIPQLVAGGGEETLSKSGVEMGQMTIFYAGQVMVFDDLPADRAKEIMMLGSKFGAAQNPRSATFSPPLTAQSPAESATSIPNIVPAYATQERAHHRPQPALGSDLPIARKNSLARFLEKRKDRIAANAPYQASKPEPAPKPAKTEEWLGLAPQFSLQVQRHWPS